MITSRDRQILRHIDEFDFITIEQARKMVFPHMERGYEYARQRLQRLCNIENRLKAINNTATKTKVFVDVDFKGKNISLHRICTMNLYCNLIGAGVEIEEFKLEKEWNNGKVRSDAFCVMALDNGNHKYRFRLLIETNTSNNKLNLKKYDDIKEEILSVCNNNLPRIVLIDDRDHLTYDTNQYQIIKLDYKITNLQNLFV